VKKITKIVLGIVAVFIFLFILGLSGGNTSEKQTSVASDSSEVNSASAEASPQVYKVGDRVVVGERAYTVNNVKTASMVGDEYVNAKATGIYVIIDMTIENLGKESSTMGTNDVKLMDSEGRTFESDTKAWVYLKDNILLKQIQPGLPVHGETIFDVPQGIKCGLQVSEGGFGSEKELIALGQT
jgi:signal peptidase I